MSVNDAARLVIARQNTVSCLKGLRQNTALWNAFYCIISNDWKSLDISSSSTHFRTHTVLLDEAYRKLLIEMYEICSKLNFGDVMRMMKCIFEKGDVSSRKFETYMESRYKNFPLTNINIDEDVKDFINEKKVDVNNIYDQNFNGSEQQKQAICIYMSSVPMSNGDCELVIDRLAEQRTNQHGGKAGTVGFMFSSGHPKLIMTFIDNVVQTLHHTDTESGKLYSIDFGSLQEKISVFMPEYRKGIDQTKIYRGIFVDCNCKRWHVDRHIISLFELLETYKWKTNNTPYIHWLAPRERRDGRFAFKAFMNNTWQEKRANPGPPNEYEAMIKSLI